MNEGGELDMAVVYATLIIHGRKTFAQVPDTLKQQVADYLLSLDMPELVPVSYGGTMEG